MRPVRDVGPDGGVPVGQEVGGAQPAVVLVDAQQARLDLSRTDVLAPSDGLVTNLQLTTGQYAALGQPLLAFIDIRDYWVSAEYRENSLGNVKPGDQAEIAFDVLPGRIYQGTVENIGWAVARGSQTGASSMGALPTVKNETGWVRDPQRFPVKIDVTGKAPPGVRYNAQANVIVYAGGNPITDGIGWLWIRLVSILSYVA